MNKITESEIDTFAIALFERLGYESLPADVREEAIAGLSGQRRYNGVGL